MAETTGGKMNRRPPLDASISQKIRLVPGALRVLRDVLLGVVTGPFRGKNGTTTFRRHVMASAIKAITGNFTPLELKYIAPNCVDVYLQFCQSKGLEPDLVTSESGVNGFWIGSKSASCIVIHFHGGGFVMDISPEHLALWHRMVEHFSSDGNDIAVFFAIYTLMPYAVYPTQLQEGVEAFSYVVNELGRDPSDIILSGDSAGGNLCVAIASQLKRPSPDVTKVPIEKQVRGMLLMSPWLSFDVTYQSMIDNLPKDIDNPKSLVEWAKLYLSGRESNYYTEPILAPTDWWSDIPVKNTFIVAGSDEIFVDSIKLFAETFQEARTNTELVISEGEFHIEPFIGPIMGDHRETQTEREMKKWLASQLE